MKKAGMKNRTILTNNEKVISVEWLGPVPPGQGKIHIPHSPLKNMILIVKEGGYNFRKEKMNGKCLDLGNPFLSHCDKSSLGITRLTTLYVFSFPLYSWNGWVFFFYQFLSCSKQYVASAHWQVLDCVRNYCWFICVCMAALPSLPWCTVRLCSGLLPLMTISGGGGRPNSSLSFLQHWIRLRNSSKHNSLPVLFSLANCLDWLWCCSLSLY
jgi:hypothetical protein